MSRWASVAGAVCALMVLGPAAFARARLVHCRITVDGRTYLDGPCMFEAEKDGSFTVGVGTETVGPSPYYAYVNKNEDGSAEASWNEIPDAAHADAKLGTVRQKGACWTNERAEICAY